MATAQPENPLGPARRSFLDLVYDQKMTSAADPGSQAEQFRLAVMHLLLDAPNSAREAERLLAALGDYRQRPLGRLLYAHVQNELGEHEAATRELNEVLGSWETKQPLQIEKAVLCLHAPDRVTVHGFERYEPAPNNTVRPGGFAVIYMQVKNFTLSRQGDRQLLSLRYAWELIDAYGKPIRIDKWMNAPQEDRMDHVFLYGSVKEFYQWFRLPLPVNLPIGDFTIRITAHDGNGPKDGKPAIADVPIHVEEYWTSQR
jgi:hypothetical protein